MSLLIIYDITGKNFHNYLFLCELDTFVNIVKILHLGPIIKCLINLIHGSKENYIIIFFIFLMKCTLVVPLTNRDLTVAARVNLFTLPVTVRLRFPLQRLFRMFSNLFSILFCIFSFFCGKALSYYILADSDSTILQNLPILNIFCQMYVVHVFVTIVRIDTIRN